MPDRNALNEWIDLLNDSYLSCLIEVAAVLLADQCGLDVESWTEAD
jgi:hypothetical protein